MTRPFRAVAAVLAAAAFAPAAFAADPPDDLDALQLESAPEAKPQAQEPALRLFVEGVAGSIDQRFGLPSLDARRLSLDLNYSARLADGLRAVLSDRVDNVRPTDATMGNGVNSLREAYLGWQRDDGSALAEFGRVNLRNGPAYGYNPTDYFRDGALRVVTTSDPLSLRENRLGTGMLLGQYLWNGDAVAIALAPKLAERPSTATYSADFGATNNRSRALLSYSFKSSDRFSGQLLALFDDDRGPQVGASATALVSESVVAFVEASHGRDRELAGAVAAGGVGSKATRSRASAGATYTAPFGTSLTAEYEYNGFALDRDGFKSLLAQPGAAVAYLVESQRRQEIASRGAVLLYANHKGVVWKSLDVTALVRISTDDHSRLSWVEWRYHWPRVDIALQWQQTGGGADTQFGMLPYKRTLQLLGAVYF